MARVATKTWTIWITRAEPAASATSAKVRALGFETVVAPLLAVRAIAGARVELADAAALAFTSANGVAAFARLKLERGLPVFAVGDATATAARAAGFADVVSAKGDVAALAAVLAARKAELHGAIIYPAGARPARDLAGLVAGVGLEVRQVAVYEIVRMSPSDAFMARLSNIDAVLIHSARAAEALAGVLKQHPAAQLVACCLSPQTARPLAGAGLAEVRVAAAPHEDALLALLPSTPLA